MARWFLIDAHNALHRLGGCPENAEAQRKSILAKVRETLTARKGGIARGDRVHLVFDAAKGGPHAGNEGKDGVVSWSYATGSADDEIVGILHDAGGKREGMDVVLVSDDRELRGRASQLGSRSLHVHEWFGAKDEAERRAEEASGPPLTAADFGLPETIDLDGAEPDPDDSGRGGA